MKKIFILLLLFSNLFVFDSKPTIFKREQTTDNHISESIEKLKNLKDKYKTIKMDPYETFPMVGLTKPHFGEAYLDGGTEIENFQRNNFSMREYFENLFDYIPYNSVGSCGYVALIAAMSYYDTFYNDDIIPSIYESGEYNAKNKSDLRYKSPGVIRLPYNENAYPSYYEFCNETQNIDLQSKLLLLNNKNSSNFTGGTNGWTFNDLLNNFYSSKKI